MSAEHTRGPWQASDVLYQLNFRTFVNVEAEGEFLAAVSSEPQIREATLANARLIAASPCLLDAAQIASYAIAQYLDEPISLNQAGLYSALKKLDAAIARATDQGEMK